MPSSSAQARREARSPRRWRAAGRRTALIEREHVGGTCINEGCTPTKTMVASARVAYLARARRGLRGRAPDPSASTWPGARAEARHRQQLPRRERAPASRRAEASTSSAPRRASPGQRAGRRGRPERSTADLIFINTGAPPAAPTSTGLDRIPVARLDHHHGARPGTRAPARAGRRLRRARVRADVPPLRQPGDGRAARPPAPGPRGRRRGRRRSPTSCARTASRSCSTAKRSARRASDRGRSRLHGAGRRRRARRSTGSHLLVAAGRAPNTDGLHLDAGRRRD